MEAILLAKKARPFDQIALDEPIPEIQTDIIDKLNAVIGSHNQISDDFQSRLETAREQLEADAVSRVIDEFTKRRAAIEGIQQEILEAGNRIKAFEDEIAKLEREIVAHRQPAEELNNDLHKYLGHKDLQLQVMDMGYRIMRRDESAEHLSEGEMTAIALLYFLKSLEDWRYSPDKGVVVFDDPVSSLDTNALYAAFGLIRQRTENVSQVFILTHNFLLFRQVRNWFHNLKGQKKSDVAKRPARFYMLECKHDGTHRCSKIRTLDQLLEEFESEYHYLFARVFRAAHEATQASLEQNYMLPNLARRLLEAFLAFRQPHTSGELWQKLQNVTFDSSKKMRIIRFLHTHSHGDAIGEDAHDLSLLSEGQAILKDLLDLMNAEDPSHVTAMNSLVSAAPSASGAG